MPRLFLSFAIAAWASLFLNGCLPGGDSDPAKLMHAAEERQKLGDYPAAIRLYERALNGTAASAEVHFRLGLLYLDKVAQPVSAAHHFERCLSLDGEGHFAKESTDYRARAERLVLASSGELGFLTREEAARLKNENLALRKQLSSRAGQAGLAGLYDKAAIYRVESGDTLANIARKTYGNPNRSKEIQEANAGRLPDATKLKPGMLLLLPPP